MASSSVGVFEELRRPGDRELFAERTLVAKAAAGDRAAFAEPYPDALLDADPLRRLERRAGIELAFVAAVQRLSPGQRATLILRDVLGFSARETADILGTSVSSVNSALHRARAGDENGRREPLGDEAALVARYVEAWEAADVEALVSLLREDARMTMPPTPSWYLGRDAIGTFFASFFASEAGTDTYLSPTRANRQPALAVYTRGAATEPYRPLAVKVLTLDGDAIAAITGFTDPRLFGYFGLSSRR